LQRKGRRAVEQRTTTTRRKSAVFLLWKMRAPSMVNASTIPTNATRRQLDEGLIGALRQHQLKTLRMEALSGNASLPTMGLKKSGARSRHERTQVWVRRNRAQGRAGRDQAIFFLQRTLVFSLDQPAVQAIGSASRSEAPCTRPDFRGAAMAIGLLRRDQAGRLVSSTTKDDCGVL
jgi:hypothetical protein